MGRRSFVDQPRLFEKDILFFASLCALSEKNPHSPNDCLRGWHSVWALCTKVVMYILSTLSKPPGDIPPRTNEEASSITISLSDMFVISACTAMVFVSSYEVNYVFVPISPDVWYIVRMLSLISCDTYFIL